MLADAGRREEALAHYSEAVRLEPGYAITPEDLKGLAIDVMDSGKIYKSGACSLLFTGVQIMATGLVHACACVDVNASLTIGDLNELPLRDILSSRNALYMGLIEEQQKGLFRDVCRECGFYKSIYHSRSQDRKEQIPLRSILRFGPSPHKLLRQ